MKQQTSNDYLNITCGDCANGTWDEKFINKDINGEPFLKHCQHGTWLPGLTRRYSTACKHFKKQ